MTPLEIYQKMGVLREVFDIVRLVDVTRTAIIHVSEDGTFRDEPYHCFAVWERDHRCVNCISAKVFANRTRMTKFEFIKNQVCFVTAQIVTIDDKPYILEMVQLLDDKTLFGAYEKGPFIEKLTAYNAKIYTDSLTGCYNRRYFDEQLSGLQNTTAIATVDIDNFKSVNDTFGHEGGDAALKTLANLLMRQVRGADAVIRLGGDEFVIVFQNMNREDLFKKLDKIRTLAAGSSVEGYPELHFSISIGGYYCGTYSPDAFKQSDDRLYEAKKTKNAVVV